MQVRMWPVGFKSTDSPDIVDDIPIRALKQLVNMNQSHASSNYPISETSGVKYDINGAITATTKLTHGECWRCVKSLRTTSRKITITNTYQCHAGHWSQANHWKYYSGWYEWAADDRIRDAHVGRDNATGQSSDKRTSMEDCKLLS
jgi:hypothetical protein